MLLISTPLMEIDLRFDEMVDFSGIGTFIDTPVKRYSSGMYVRLAFSVAAHFEPEILLIDEVLSVGDAEFQRRCLGRMEEFKLHVRGALRNGVSRDEIEDTLIQLGIYAGVPAAIAAFRSAREVLEEEGLLG